jgi:hypothetical protein
MSAVLVAAFNEYEIASRVRIELFRDGFPTDRVEVTACCDMGRAGMVPAKSQHDQFVGYFRTLLSRDDEQQCAQTLAERVESGGATVTVHPRGTVETARATEILAAAHPLQMAEHDLANQPWEQAASRSTAGPWIANFWLEPDPACHCIYCRLFEGGSKSASWQRVSVPSSTGA